MATETLTDAEAFLMFLADEVKDGGCEKSPEELLQSWRTMRSEAVEDIQRGIEDLETGHFHRFEDIDAAIRKKFRFAPRQR